MAIKDKLKQFFFGEDEASSNGSTTRPEDFVTAAPHQERRASPEEISKEELNEIRRRLKSLESSGSRLTERVEVLEREHDKFIDATGADDDFQYDPNELYITATNYKTIPPKTVLRKLMLPPKDGNGNYSSDEDREFAEKIMAAIRAIDERESTSEPPSRPEEVRTNPDYWKLSPEDSPTAQTILSLMDEGVSESERISPQEAKDMLKTDSRK